MADQRQYKSNREKQNECFIMSNLDHLSESDRALISEYEIECEVRTVFFVDGYRYDKLKNAVRFAKIAAERQQAPTDGEDH